MRLLSMPFIIKQLVIQHLSINQLFFLSLCSKNTRNFIKHTQKYQFEREELHRVSYFMTQKSVAILVGRIAWARSKYLIALFKDPRDAWMISGFEDGVPIEEVRLNELGTSVDSFRSPMNHTELCIKYTADNVKSILQSVHNQLCELLSRDPEIWTKATFEDAQLLPFKNNQVRLMEIHGEDERSSVKVNEYFSRFPCLETLEWWGPDREDFTFEEDSRLYQLDTLDVHQFSLARGALKYFNGRQAFLNSNRITPRDVTEFFNAWKSGEKFQNLEVICMKNCSHIPWIRESIKVKKLNTNVEYSYTRKQPFKPSEYKFESQLYMVRESDGRVASILFEDRKVTMGVWTMTESEFLEKFQKPIGSKPPAQQSERI